MRRGHAWALACASWIGSIACEAPREEPPPEAVPAPIADVTEEAPPTSWPTDVEDLSASLASFTTIESCIESLRAHTPTIVAEGLADLEYDAFFADVCRSTAAVRDRSSESCDAIEVSSLRRGCRTRLAIVAADPALCPADRAIEGRDPLCVAWAARDPGLCRAVAAGERSACEAVLAGEPRRCARALDRPRCEAWIRRYGATLGSERHASEGTRDEPSMHVDVVRVIPSATGAASETAVSMDLDGLARGVHLAADGCRHRLVLDHRGASAAIVGRSGARIEIPLTIAEPPLDVAIDTLELAHPELGRVRGGSGTIVITTIALARGAPLAGTLEATIPAAPGEWRARGTFSTFVRDFDDLPARCAGDRMPSP